MAWRTDTVPVSPYASSASVVLNWDLLGPTPEAGRWKIYLPEGSGVFLATIGSRFQQCFSRQQLSLWGMFHRNGGGGAGCNPSPRRTATAPVLSTYSVRPYASDFTHITLFNCHNTHIIHMLQMRKLRLREVPKYKLH